MVVDVNVVVVVVIVVVVLLCVAVVDETVVDVKVSVVVVAVPVVLLCVVVVDVALVFVEVAVLVVVVVVVVDAVVVVVVDPVVVVDVQVWQRPGQLLDAASRMKLFGLLQFLRRNPGTKHPIGSGTPLQDGSVHVLHVTGHWMRTASAGLPSALQRDWSRKQESGSGSGSPLQLGVVVVVVDSVVVVVVDAVVVVVDAVVVVNDNVVVVVVELTQLLHSAGHADLSWVATATTGVLQNSSGTEQISTGSYRPLHRRDGAGGVSGHELHSVGHSDETSRPSSLS